MRCVWFQSTLGVHSMCTGCFKFLHSRSCILDPNWLPHRQHKIPLARLKLKLKVSAEEKLSPPQQMNVKTTFWRRTLHVHRCACAVKVKQSEWGNNKQNTPFEFSGFIVIHKYQKIYIYKYFSRFLYPNLNSVVRRTRKLHGNLSSQASK